MNSSVSLTLSLSLCEGEAASARRELRRCFEASEEAMVNVMAARRTGALQGKVRLLEEEASEARAASLQDEARRREVNLYIRRALALTGCGGLIGG